MANDDLSGLSILTNQTAAAAEPGADGETSPHDGDRRKVRHNLTERRRVDRMNQLFNKLYTAIEEAAPATDVIDKATGQPVLGVLGADGKPINPSRWSKADVLEGALNVINDLRQQLSEERLARTLGVPTASGEDDDADDAVSTSDGHSYSLAGSESCPESDEVSEDAHELSGAHLMLMPDHMPTTAGVPLPMPNAPIE